MADHIRYFINRDDACKPVYEVNYTTKKWRVVDFRRRQYGDDFISGKLRKPSYFSGWPFEEVEKPEPQPGHRLAA